MQAAAAAAAGVFQSAGADAPPVLVLLEPLFHSDSLSLSSPFKHSIMLISSKQLLLTVSLCLCARQYAY